MCCNCDWNSQVRASKLKYFTGGKEIKRVQKRKYFCVILTENMSIVPDVDRASDAFYTFDVLHAEKVAELPCYEAKYAFV